MVILSVQVPMVAEEAVEAVGRMAMRMVSACWPALSASGWSSGWLSGSLWGWLLGWLWRWGWLSPLRCRSR